MRHIATFTSELLGPEGAAQFAWSPGGNVLAVAGARTKKVVLFDAAGEVIASLTVPDPSPDYLYDEAAETPVLALAWHPSGSHLAVLPRGHSFVMVWSTEGGTARVDGGVKPVEVTALAWCPTALQLALGTAKGGGVVYDCASRSTTPLALGRAAKPVSCMAWSAGAAPGGLLALGCRGGLLLLARPVDGQLVRSIQLKGAVSQMQFCELTAAGNTGDDTTSASGGALLAANVGRRSVCIWQLPAALAGEAAGGGAAAGSSGGAFELAFREGYGELETYCWVHPRLLAAGFSSGQLVAVALGGGLAPGAGTGTERYSARCLQSAVSSLSWCAATGLLAAGGGCQAALLRCQGLEVVPGGEAVSLELDGGARLNNLQLCPPDGKRLTAATSAGRVMQLLARPPLLHGAWGGVVAYVDHSSCASEALLVDLGRSGPAAAGSPVAVPLPAEPDQLALGPGCLAAAQGDQVWLQGTDPSPATALLPPPVAGQYPVEIAQVFLNRHCLLLLSDGGRVFVQPTADGKSGGGSVAELRGDGGEPFAASCAALTEHFILLGLLDGTLAFYGADDCQLVSEYEHSQGIAAAYPDAAGTLVLFQDAAGGLFLYDAQRGELMVPPDWAGGQLHAAAWDGADQRLVAAVSSAGTVHLYRHIPASVAGPGLKLVGTQEAPQAGAALLALQDGVLAWHMPDGSLHPQLLESHRHLADTPPRGSRSASRTSSSKWQVQLAAAATSGLGRDERLVARCRQALALCHVGRALEAAKQLGDVALLKEVAAAALQFLELPVAVAAYEAAGDEQSLAQLRPLLGEDDENFLAGQLTALAGGDADRAEQLLLASSRPSAAIELRRGLGHWERALELAEHLEPHALGGLALLRAQAMEAEGQVEAAMAAFEQALSAPDLTVSSGAAGAAERRAEARAGMARCAILLGDVERGMELAAEGGSLELLLQCAELLEGEGRSKEAGQLFARAGEYERAARLFMAGREFGLLDGVMEHAGSPALWLQYAQAKEDLGSYGDAARAYEQAGDVAAAVRVLLERLRDAETAAELAKRAGSKEASLAVAQHCEHAGLPQLAMEQYWLAGESRLAFWLAKKCDAVPAFAAWARQAGDAAAALLAAEHFEAQGSLAVAAELCAQAGQAERAARLYIQAGGDSLPAAIKLASEGRDPAAVALVLEHLQAVDSMGATLQDLHMALGNAEAACAVAVARAQREQTAGNYKAARDVLLGACLALQQRGMAATPTLLSLLRLVHSYLLVRILVRQGDHLAAARLLLLVADGIDAFPKHVVPILTSAVIEFNRAALHGPAQRWAAVLMEPRYAGQVSPAFAKKIEAIAKQPAWTAEKAAAEEPRCECMFCGAAGPESDASCATCRRALPFCAASGRRMVLADWSACPSCCFPCRGRDLARYASVERACPMCEAPLAVHDVRRVFDPISQLRGTAFAGLVPSSSK